MLQRDILPKFSDDMVEAVIIHVSPQSRAPSVHVQQFGLTMPIAFDFDGELFRRYRLPNYVVPLNLVIDREGKVAHLGTELEEAETAIEQLLAKEKIPN